ncbi:hypothetical protein NHQ30_008753 [Ciborinia camelliae]|nr:hypothetical protein NHQ30_008753 [Ciborinia camelliae]
MQYSTLFVSLFLSTAVAAQGFEAYAEEQVCRRIIGLNAFIQAVHNQTKLDSVTEKNATLAKEIQSKAVEMTTLVNGLESNTTLMAHCAPIISAVNNDLCTQQFLLQNFVDFASNETLVNLAVAGNKTKFESIELIALVADNTIEEFQANATMQAACAPVFVADGCKLMVKLKKLVDFAADDAKVAYVAKGDAAKIAHIKGAAMLVTPQLMAMEANSTFVAKCESLGFCDNSTKPSGSYSSAPTGGYSSGYASGYSRGGSSGGKFIKRSSAASINSMSLTALFVGALALGMAALPGEDRAWSLIEGLEPIWTGA